MFREVTQRTVQALPPWWWPRVDLCVHISLSRGVWAAWLTANDGDDGWLIRECVAKDEADAEEIARRLTEEVTAAPPVLPRAWCDLRGMTVT